MEITKLGHCCLLIETNDVTILTDPGAYSNNQNVLSSINIVLITHEHGDHLHVGSLKAVLENNPEAKVVTNSGVGKILDAENIKHEILEGNATSEVNNILLEAFDSRHQEIYQDFGQVQNTGYFIAEKLFYPGDAFYNPQKPVEILALPVTGPWCRIGEAVEYALEIKPKFAFPVHDGMLQKDKIGGSHAVPSKILSQNNIEFIPLTPEDSHEF